MQGFQRDIAKLPETSLKGYGCLVGMGYDTLVETFNLDVIDEFWGQMKAEKERAQERDPRGQDVATVSLGDNSMQILSHGGRQGTPFILQCPDFTIDWRSPKTQWNVTVRYTSLGLWAVGHEALRRRVRELLLTVCTPRAEGGKRWSQVSSVHYAFDFYSPKMSRDMKPSILGDFISHSSSKKHMNMTFRSFKASAWGRAGYLETVTLGHKRNVEVQVYDKGKEIVEASGKEWMLKIWEAEGYCPPDELKLKHVWRLELRFGKDFLDNRGIKDFEEFDRCLDKACIEAIMTKRLTQDNGDARIRRRPLHPLWAMAARAVGSPERMLALGKIETQTASEKADMLEKQAAGIARSIVYLRNRAVNKSDMIVFARSMTDRAFMDPEHLQKCEKIERRYEFIDRGRT